MLRLLAPQLLLLSRAPPSASAERANSAAATGLPARRAPLGQSVAVIAATPGRPGGSASGPARSNRLTVTNGSPGRGATTSDRPLASVVWCSTGKTHGRGAWAGGGSSTPGLPARGAPGHCSSSKPTSAVASSVTWRPPPRCWVIRCPVMPLPLAHSRS